MNAMYNLVPSAHLVSQISLLTVLLVSYRRVRWTWGQDWLRKKLVLVVYSYFDFKYPDANCSIL